MYRDKFILIGRKVVWEPDLLKWGMWIQSHNRSLKRTFLPGGVYVSTVFLGLNHSLFSNEPPLIFETMIFGGKLDTYRWRYRTYAGALAGHKKAINEALRFKYVSLGKKIERNNNRKYKARYLYKRK